MPKRRRLIWVGAVVVFVGAALGVAWSWYSRSVAPTEPGDPFFVRYEKGVSFDHVILDLVDRGVVRNANAFKLYCYLNRAEQMVRAGTFEIHKGMTADQVLRALKHPVEQQVRIPEGWWMVRVAPILAEHDVCTA